MISKALSFIEEVTNNYLTGIHGPSTENYAILGNIAKLVEGGDTTEAEDGSGIIISLVNIEEDRISKNPNGIYREGGNVVRRNPSILLNLYVLFSANVSTYSVGLSRISNVIECFQNENFFMKTEHSLPDPELVKLQLELYTMNFEQVNHLWSTMGGKYLPSVLYKLKMIPVYNKENSMEGDLIREIQMNKNAISGVLGAT
ncbi:MAG: DUF4255 domain-containing protein [Flavobacteriaceae bacterium]|nr:MAG: DUF4255 domain-containing protein [Flavobacteriaceae bacterium]